MPLYMAEYGHDLIIGRITGSDKIKKHLENMGFVVGEKIQIVNKVDENVIVKVKGISIAISHELAKRIYV